MTIQLGSLNLPPGCRIIVQSCGRDVMSATVILNLAIQSIEAKRTFAGIGVYLV